MKILMVLLLATGLSAPTAHAIAQTPSSSSSSEQRQRWEAWARAGDIPGLGVAVVADDAVALTFIGDQRQGEAPVDASTVFEAASLGKPVLAYLALRLVDQGKLALDTPLIDLVPGLPLPTDDPRVTGVTLRTALSHTTGLEGDDSRSLTFKTSPGAAFSYFPAGYRLVQRVVEQVEGRALDEVAQREVFGPLAMTDSSFVWTPALEGRLASRHDALGAPISRRWSAETPANAAASLLTTPADYGRFLRAVMRAEGLSAASAGLMLSPQTTVAEADGVAWSLGWGLETAKATFFHYGDDGAAKAYAIGSASDGEALVYFANSTYGLSIAREMAGEVAPGDQPALDWLDYNGVDSPVRLARRDVLRAFVEGGEQAGVSALDAAVARWPDLAVDGVTSWIGWALDTRGLTEARSALQAWRPSRP